MMQRSCGVSFSGDSSLDTALSHVLKGLLLEQGSWTRWPPGIPSNLTNSVILWHAEPNPEMGHWDGYRGCCLSWIKRGWKNSDTSISAFQRQAQGKEHWVLFRQSMWSTHFGVIIKLISTREIEHNASCSNIPEKWEGGQAVCTKRLWNLSPCLEVLPQQCLSDKVLD